MSIAASPPAEVLLVIFEHLFFTKDLLCAALVNRSWRAACISLNQLWRCHWQSVQKDDTHRRRTLAKNLSDVDWFAETSAAVRQNAAWRTGKFTARTIKLPPHFCELQSVDDRTALIMLRRPGNPGEPTSWGGAVVTFQLVNKTTFETIHDLPRIPRAFPKASNVNGLGHIFSIDNFPHTYFYIPKDGYEWLGSPPKAPGQEEPPWPQLPGFVFIGRQEIKSEGRVHLHVDDAHTQSPSLSIHEQDIVNLHWVRYGPWKGQRRMINTGDETFWDHTLTDECVVISSPGAIIMVHHRTKGQILFLNALTGHAAQYSFEHPEGSTTDYQLDKLKYEVQQFIPTSASTEAHMTVPLAAKAKELVKVEEYSFCRNVTSIGKNLYCVVGHALVIFPDYTRPFDGGSKRAPLLMDLGGNPLSFAADNSHLVIIAPSLLYLVDLTQFNGDEPPAKLSAVKVTRSGIVASRGFGHRENNEDKGATARVTVADGAIYEVLKIDHSWWDETDDTKQPSKTEKKPVDHFVRIYNFE